MVRTLLFAQLGFSLLSAPAHPAPVDEKSWLACQKGEDCASVSLGCYYWQPVNRSHAGDMEKKYPSSCLKSNPPGRKPPLECRDRLCAVAPWTVKDWKAFSSSEKSQTVMGRVDACLKEAKLAGSGGVTRIDFFGLQAPFLKKSDDRIAKKDFEPTQTVDEVLGASILCADVVAAYQARVAMEGDPRTDPNGPMFRIELDWKSCERDEDCVAGLTDCYSWLPIHRKYLTEQEGPRHGRRIQGTAITCTRFTDPGPAPRVACRSGWCL